MLDLCQIWSFRSQRTCQMGLTGKAIPLVRLESYNTSFSVLTPSSLQIAKTPGKP